MLHQAVTALYTFLTWSGRFFSIDKFHYVVMQITNNRFFTPYGASFDKLRKSDCFV